MKFEGILAETLHRVVGRSPLGAPEISIDEGKGLAISSDDLREIRPKAATAEWFGTAVRMIDGFSSRRKTL